VTAQSAVFDLHPAGRDLRAPPRDAGAYRTLDATRYGSLGALLADALVQFQTEEALVEHDRRRVTHRLRFVDVARAVRRLARRFEAAGVGPDDRVAILMTNQSRWPVAATAAFLRGAVVVPLDYKLSPPEREALLAHARPAVLVTEYPLFAQHRSGALDAVPLVLVSEAPATAALGRAQRWGPIDEDAVGDESAGGPRCGALVPPAAPRSRDDLATIVYSSGTGGAPKGCMLTHGAYLAQLDALVALYPLCTGDRWFSILPTNHAIDFMCGFLGPFAGGATVVHQRTLRPEFLFATLRAERITHMAVVPLLLAAFERSIREKLEALPTWQRRAIDAAIALNQRLTERAPNRDLSRRLLAPIHDAFGGALRLIFCGGAYTEPERARFFYSLGLPVVIGYGLTEACTVATVNDLRPFRDDTVGRAVPGVEVRIVDPDAQGVGEVWLRGPTLMKGYLDDAEQTAAALTPDGWLRTGDLGWMDAAHHLHLVGRTKNMIVTRGGKNVYPEDVEGAFARLPCEELCVAAAHFLWPRRDDLVHEHLLAIVRLPSTATQSDRRRFVDALRLANQRLPDFKRVAGVLFVHEPFPRTASMKIKRAPLAAQIAREHGPEDVVRIVDEGAG
jgi:long-chain acyl-CoA synthetase